MADEPGSKAAAPQVPVFTESLPAQIGAISAIASANAPFLYFDGAPNFGYNSGIVSITLDAVRFQAIDGKVVNDRVNVAYLRMSLEAAQRLRDSINGALAIAAPPKPEEVN